MILEYNYDNGMSILEYIKKSELVTLTIKQTKDSNQKFVMSYTLISDYSEKSQDIIKEVLSNSLEDRLQLINILNQFIENQSLGNVNSFCLDFNSLSSKKKCEIYYSSSYKTNEQKDNPIQELIQCLENYDSIVTKMGIHSQEVPKVFKKCNGKGKKFAPVTFKELGDILRTSLLGE